MGRNSMFYVVTVFLLLISHVFSFYKSPWLIMPSWIQGARQSISNLATIRILSLFSQKTAWQDACQQKNQPRLITPIPCSLPSPESSLFTPQQPLKLTIFRGSIFSWLPGSPAVHDRTNREIGIRFWPSVTDCPNHPLGSSSGLYIDSNMATILRFPKAPVWEATHSENQVLLTHRSGHQVLPKQSPCWHIMEDRPSYRQQWESPSTTTLRILVTVRNSY